MPGSIDGIISNLNTTEIVEAIITAERRTVNRLTDRQTEATNQLTTYNAIAAKIVALQSSIAPLTRPATFDAASLSVSNTDILSATATGTVTPGSYTLSVDSLASNHQIVSQGFADTTADLGTGTVSITIGDASPHTIVLDDSNRTLMGLKNAINDARIGVTASLISDGSSNNSYRLMLASIETGTTNAIAFSSSLSGGSAPDFSTSSFDVVEMAALVTGTSAIALGAGASYTGAENKTYAFTVAGSGEQTVGGGAITINWTDGTNSGSFDVSAADSEVALTGTGADGLTLTFGAGTLAAGDKFSVQTFSPLVQVAADAKVTFGSSAGGGAPITVSSASNRITDLIGGLTLDLKSVTTTSPVTITAEIDRDAIKGSIQDMLAKYTDVMKAIDEQFSFDPNTKEGGLLLGDQFLLSLQSGLRSPLYSALGDTSMSLRTLRGIGIHTMDSGAIGLVEAQKLFDALDTDLQGVQNLFADSGKSDNALISFLTAGTAAVESTAGYEVDITQAATHTVLRGDDITDPATSGLLIGASNNAFKLTVDGAVSDTIVLSAKTYTSGAQLAAEINSKIEADRMIGGRGATVAWVDLGDTGYLTFTSAAYGSSSRISAQAADANRVIDYLGLTSGGSLVAGKDVAGTINGESATGTGRILTGDSDNSTTDGISIEVRMTESDVVGGSDATLTFTRGFASRLNRVADAIARSIDGSIARRTKGIENQIEDLKVQIEDQEERLAVRRQKLFERFIELERALAQFQTQGDFMTQQLSQISANTKFITGG